jgi:hypothetical protein
LTKSLCFGKVNLLRYKTKNMQASIQKVEHSIHQRVERALRHPIALASVLGFMAIALIRFDTGMNQVVQQAYTQGFGWIGTYMHHEHPAHSHSGIAISRIPTISGSNG